MKKHKQKQYRQTHAQKARQNLRYRFVENVARGVRRMIATDIKKSKYEIYLGITCEQFKKYIKYLCDENNLFFSDHGCSGWHLDHIIPISSFSLCDIEFTEKEFTEKLKSVFHYTNYRPLGRVENMKKFTKIA